MRSVYPNLLTLTEWAQYMGLDAWSVAGFCNSPQPFNHSTPKCCEGDWAEFTYQRGQLARTDISQAIMAAEELFATNIGYWPAPKALTAEPRDYPWGDNMLQFRGMVNKKGEMKSVRLRYGYIMALGAEVCEQIEEAVAITPTYGMDYHTTKDLVAVPDHFTFTITLPDGMTPDEIRVFHTASNRLNEPREEWEIRPLTITMSDQEATITGDAWLFGQPQLLIGIDTQCLDATDVAEAYVAEVEVWRCRLDQTQHGEFVWENDGCTSVPCSDVRRTFCASIRRQACSYVVPRPATYDTESESFKWTTECLPSEIRHLEVNYKAGIPLVNYRMERKHGRIIAMLASSLLDCELCACGCVKDRLARYSNYEHVEKDEGIGSVKSYERIKREKTADNPFGERYGQIQAWMAARNWMVCK